MSFTYCGITRQSARKRTRITFLSYSASVARVISTLSAVKTRPPLRRQTSRSYWQGPISGCVRQSAATFGANAIAVCRTSASTKLTQTYWVPAGTLTTRFGDAVGGSTGVGANAGCVVSEGIGVRATAAPRTSSGRVMGIGCRIVGAQAPSTVRTTATTTKRL